MLAAIVGSVVSIVAVFFIKPFALQIVLFLVKRWTCVYTAAVPAKERGDRRAEIESDLHEQVSHFRAEGHTRSEIAAQLLCRSVLGLKDDLAWSMPYVLSILAEKLVKGSAAIKRFKTPPMLLASLGAALLTNWAFLESESSLPWVAWPLLNGGVLAFTVLLWNQQHPWARRGLALWVGLGVAVFVVSFITVVLKHRLYEAPLFQESMIGLGLATPPVAFAMVVGSKECRARVFRNLWWPALLSWGLIVAASIGAASLLGVRLDTLLALWAVMAVMAASLFAAAGVFTLTAAAGWYGSLWGSAAGMRWVAAGIRRLT